MESQQHIDYNRIAAAIEFVRDNFKKQPGLEEIAAAINLSPHHFHRLFHDWAGVTPKQFLQYITLEHAKQILSTSANSLFDTALESGLSGSGRLHDLFVKIEGMTPNEYRNGAEALQINYSYADTPFGPIIVASTNKGICHLAFADEGKHNSFATLQQKFPNAQYQQFVDRLQQGALFIFSQDWQQTEQIKLHLKGSEFQLKIWQALLSIRSGELTTYNGLAMRSGLAGASRAAGTAIGSNPVALLIPCHRVIRSTGETGQYHWGSTRKAAIIGWEAAQHSLTPNSGT
jgi:AraC family transcriptional regulator, regulatory protein of adaptative response / methylated-DNA-[protein]-cysteine methyltransferase